jgi:hypothetical protein
MSCSVAFTISPSSSAPALWLATPKNSSGQTHGLAASATTSQPLQLVWPLLFMAEAAPSRSDGRRGCDAVDTRDAEDDDDDADDDDDDNDDNDDNDDDDGDDDGAACPRVCFRNATSPATTPLPLPPLPRVAAAASVAAAAAAAAAAATCSVAATADGGPRQHREKSSMVLMSGSV